MTPSFTDGGNVWKVSKLFFFTSHPKVRPASVLPSKQTVIASKPLTENGLMWFGHSSYYLQLNGKRILVDPVFSGSASPIAATNRSFPGSDVYSAGDIPELDVLLITHDHWDHLDMATVIALMPKVRTVVTSLGVAAHLIRWGYDPRSIKELTWGEETDENGLLLRCVTARHFSGRGFKRNRSLWSSFVIESGNFKIFAGGDSGYGQHFREIGEQHGPFDLAILECGQYNKYWKNIHMFPEEVPTAAMELKAARFMPVHWGKFKLSIHPWTEPIERLLNASQNEKQQPVVGMIGEWLDLRALPDQVNKWWSPEL